MIDDQPQPKGEDESQAQASGQSAEELSGSNVEKSPDEWVTGDEPMTGGQRSYLKTLSQQANEPFDESLSKAAASKRIDELQERTGRRGSG